MDNLSKKRPNIVLNNVLKNTKNIKCICNYEDDIKKCKINCEHHNTFFYTFKTPDVLIKSCECIYPKQIKTCKKPCYLKQNSNCYNP